MTTHTTPATASASASTTRSTHRWLALSILALAQFLVVLDASIVNIALPVLGAQLGMDTVALAWVITAYVLPFGGLLLLGGRLADRYGHRRLFLIGTIGFIAASMLAGLSMSSGMLLAARAVQGTSAALLAPAALALVTQLFPATADRTKALGIWGAVAGIGSAAGVLLGGVLTATIGWQAVFYVNVPIGILVVALIPTLITRDPASTPTRLDYPGAATITGSLVAAVGAFSAAEQLGFANPLTIGILALAVILGISFVLIERRTANPLVPLAVFGNRNLTIGNLAMLLLGAAMVALFFALSVYMQSVLHYDALTAGLTQLPLAGALVIVAGLAPSVVARIGLKGTLIGSLVILAAGLVWLAATPSDASCPSHPRAEHRGRHWPRRRLRHSNTTRCRRHRRRRGRPCRRAHQHQPADRRRPGARHPRFAEHRPHKRPGIRRRRDPGRPHLWVLLGVSRGSRLRPDRSRYREPRTH